MSEESSPSSAPSAASGVEPSATPAAPAAGPQTDATPPTEAPRRRGWLAGLILALVAFGVFAESLTYELVYDDVFLIVRNRTVTAAHQDLAQAFVAFEQEYWLGVNEDRPVMLQTRGQALYRPFTVFAWAVLAWTHDGVFPTPSSTFPALPYHLLNILGHVIAVLLLYRVALMLSDNGRLAFVAALLFAVHPLHSEAVAYVAGLSDVAAAIFVMWGVLLFQRATKDPDRVAFGPFVGLLLVMFVGSLWKEGAILLLPAAALTDFMRSRRGNGLELVPRITVYGGMLAILGVHIAIRFAAVGYLTPSSDGISLLDNPLMHEPFNDFGMRLINGLKLVAFEVWQFLWPAALSIDYSFNAIPMSSSFGEPGPLSAAVLLGMLLVLGLVRIGRWPALCWGLLFFLGTAVYTSNILLPIGTLYGERLAYMPSLGACLAAAAVLDLLLRSKRPGAVNPVGALVVLAIAVLLGARTVERNRDFETTFKLFEAAEKVSGESARVHYQLGVLFENDGIYSKAEEHFKQAVEIWPQFLQAVIALGDVYTKDRRYDQAIETFNAVLANVVGDDFRVNEIRRMMYTKRAGAKAGSGDLKGSEADLVTAASMASDDNSSKMALARIYANQGRASEAIPIVDQALLIDPRNLEALFLLAQVAVVAKDTDAYERALDGLEQTEQGKPRALAMRAEVLFETATTSGDTAQRDEAVRMFEEALDLDGELATPYIYRGRYMAQLGRHADALIDFDRALARSTDNAAALRFKAVSQLGSGRPEEALETLTALEKVRPDGDCYQLLADAYGRLGMLDEMQTTYVKLQELGVDLTRLVFERAQALDAMNRKEDAIAVLEQALAMPGVTEDVELLRSLGILYLDVGRHEEALATFLSQEQVQRMLPLDQQDFFVALNKARALTALGRDVEAAAQLELFEALVQPGDPAYVSLLHRRAQLFLRPGGAFYNPAAATELMREAIDLSGSGYPPYFDDLIEALVAARDLPAAIATAKQARSRFAVLLRFRVAEQALQRVAEGDVAGASAALRGVGQPASMHLADVIEREFSD